MRSQKTKGIGIVFGLLVGLLTTPFARAGLIVDNNLFYVNTATKTNATESFSKYQLSAFVGASIPKIYFIGWKVTSYADTLKGSAGTASITGLEMGPRFGVFFDKNHWTALALSYLPVHNGTYTSDQSVVSKLSGSGFEAELVFAPEVFKYLSPGFSLLYHSGSYSTSTSSANTTTSVSFTRNLFIPSFYLHWAFGGND